MNDWQFTNRFSDGSGTYERLAFLGDFGLKRRRTYQFTECYYPGGEYESSLESRPEGIKRVSLVFKVLPDSQAQSILLSSGGEQTIARYLEDFFHRHNSPRKRAFIMPDPFTGEDEKWRFEQHEIEMENLITVLWSTGLSLVQDIGGEPFTNSAENPNTI